MNKNISILSLAALFCLATTTQAQTSYGIKGGLNFAKIKMGASGVSYTTDANTSFYVTGYADMPLANNFSLQPGISLQGKGGSIPAGAFENEEKIKNNMMYIEVPVNLVYSIATGATGNIFLGAGPYAGFGIHAKSTMGSYTESGSFSKAGAKTFEAGLNLLAGYKFSNGFLINGGYGLGLTNVMKNDFDDTANVTAKNRVFSIGIGYQF